MQTSTVVKSDSVIKVTNKNFKTLLDIHESGRDYWIFIRIVEAFGHKFRINCIMRNGDPCGFKSNKAVSVFIPENGKWEYLADCNGIGYYYNNDYYGLASSHIAYTKGLITHAYKYIEILYK